jgi:Putative glycosyl/glycerophosphate transferases involved in teichoic acid biosynthesis TagF/TagB/EpsJ/RodC
MNELNIKTDICYVISHGFAARMLLQTGLIHQLTEKGKTVAIITPDSNDANLKPLHKNPLINIYDAQIEQTIWDDDYGVKRMYYLEDIKTNPVLWEKHLYSILYSKSKHPWKRVRPFFYYPIYRLIKYFPSIRRKFKEKEHKYLFSKKAEELLQKIKPTLVVSTYPVNFLEAKFLFAAKKKKIATLIHLLSWDNITSKGIFPVIPDQFILWGKIMYQELKEYYGTPDKAAHICGVPHFDNHIRVKKSPDYKTLLSILNLNADLPYLFVAMSSPRFAPHEIDIVEWLAKAINENVFGEDMQLVIRPHPQNVQGSLSDQRWIKRLDNLNEKRVAVDYPQLVKSKVRWSMQKSDMDHLSNLLVGCSICLNSGSTVSIDALMMDKPVILTSFDGDRKLYYWRSVKRLVNYTHLKKFIRLGGAKVVHSYESLKEEIEKYLTTPNYDLKKRRNALEMECHLNDGQSTERVVKTMLKILENI